MSPERARALGLSLFVGTVVLVGVSWILGLASGFPTGSDMFVAAGVTAVAVVYTGAGALLVTRVPRNPIGWIVIGIGLFQMLNALASGYASFALERPGPPLPWGEVSEWAALWTWLPSVGMLVTFLLLLFPDGRPPSPRWRIVGWTATVGIALALVGTMAGSWPLRHVALDDPSAAPTGLGAVVQIVGMLTIAVSAIASIASLVVRFRRATGDERQQLRWFLFAAVVVVAGVFLSVTVDTHYVVLLIGFFLIPVTTAVAILKYRLYDLDVVIKKTVVFTVVAGVLVALYLSVIALTAAGRGITRYAVAALLLVVTFGPVRRAARLLADRVVYGKRASSYEVLTEFSERMADTYATDDVLPRIATILAGATGAATATVWVRVGGALRPVASSDETATPSTAHSLPDEGLPPIPGDLAAEVRHQGELLGALSVTMPASDPIDPAREKLVRDLASQAGLVLRNVRLIEELKASRQRLVATQDEERRKIERNLHDGAQQQLVALSVKLRLIGTLNERDPSRATQMLDEAQADAQDALETLRDLARGIYPPLLADQGLVAALEAQARKAAVPTTVVGDAVGRYGQDIEAAVYFSCLEALQNVAKYAGASHATIALTNGNGALTFTVTDDGAGFDTSATSYGTGLQGIADRLAALGGTLDVRSGQGDGTRIEGQLPVEGSP